MLCGEAVTSQNISEKSLKDICQQVSLKELCFHRVCCDVLLHFDDGESSLFLCREGRTVCPQCRRPVLVSDSAAEAPGASVHTGSSVFTRQGNVAPETRGEGAKRGGQEMGRSVGETLDIKHTHTKTKCHTLFSSSSISTSSFHCFLLLRGVVHRGITGMLLGFSQLLLHCNVRIHTSPRSHTFMQGTPSISRTHTQAVRNIWPSVKGAL